MSFERLFDFLGCFTAFLAGGGLAVAEAAVFDAVGDRLLVCIFLWAGFVSVCITRVVVYITRDDHQEPEQERDDHTAHTHGDDLRHTA